MSSPRSRGPISCTRPIRARSPKRCRGCGTCCIGDGQLPVAVRCRGATARSSASMEIVFGEIRDIAASSASSHAPSGSSRRIGPNSTEIRNQIGAVTTPPPCSGRTAGCRRLWAGAAARRTRSCGWPAHRISSATCEGVGNGQWDDVVARNPDVIVLVDASWSPAAQKRQWLLADARLAGIEAVKHRRFVTMKFSDHTRHPEHRHSAQGCRGALSGEVQYQSGAQSSRMESPGKCSVGAFIAGSQRWRCRSFARPRPFEPFLSMPSTGSLGGRGDGMTDSASRLDLCSTHGDAQVHRCRRSSVRMCQKGTRWRDFPTSHSDNGVLRRARSAES